MNAAAGPSPGPQAERDHGVSQIERLRARAAI